MHTYPNQKTHKSPIDKKMLALVTLTLISSIIGGWPYLLLAAVFIYTQIIVKIPLIFIGVTFTIIIGLIITIPIIISIIRNSKQIVKISTRIAYFLLITLSTLATAGGIYNSTHNIYATIFAGFVVIVIAALIFNDSENNNFQIIPSKYTGPDGPIQKKFIPDVVSGQIGEIIATGVAILTSIFIVGNFILIPYSTHHPNFKFEDLFQILEIQIIIFGIIPLLILAIITTYFIAIRKAKNKSLQARYELSRILDNTMIVKMKSAIVDILQLDTVRMMRPINPTSTAFKTHDTYSIVVANLTQKSQMAESQIAKIIDLMIIAYPNRIKNYTPDEFNLVLNKFIKN